MKARPWVFAFVVGLVANHASSVGAQQSFQQMCAADETRLYAIAGQCHNFMQCSPQGPVVKNCPPPLVFNELISVCDWRVNVPHCNGVSSSPCEPSPCQNGGLCSTNGISFTCDCSYTSFVGTLCQTPRSTANPCQLSPCQNGGRCVPNGSSFTCDCSGINFTGTLCQTPDSTGNPCQFNPCQNGGRCNPSGSTFTCDCSGINFTGNLCQTPRSTVNPCQFNPCQNGGRCNPSGSTFTCDCSGINFTGNLCQTPNTQPCQNNPCANGGQCIPSGTSFSCYCTNTLFWGDRCQQNVCEIQSQNPCRNGGTCTPHPTVRTLYSCQCPPQFQGDTCEDAMTTPGNCCSQNPCRNGGVCSVSTLGNSDFSCDCRNTGFTGPLCDVATSSSFCRQNPCNGGICRLNPRTAAGYSCDCSYIQYTGSNCQTFLTSCDQNPCVRGTCVRLANGYRCDCTGTGYDGFRCQSPTPTIPPADQCPTLYPCPSNVRRYDYPSWTNCQGYYNCEFGTLQERFCNTGQLFDLITRTCQPQNLRTAQFCSAFFS